MTMCRDRRYTLLRACGPGFCREWLIRSGFFLMDGIVLLYLEKSIVYNKVPVNQSHSLSTPGPLASSI